MTRSQAARQYVHGHTVSVSLLSDSEDEHRPDEAVSSPSVHVHLRVQQHEQPAAEQQLRGQLLEQQQLCEALQSRSVGWVGKADSLIRPVNFSHLTALRLRCDFGHYKGSSVGPLYGRSTGSLFEQP